MPVYRNHLPQLDTETFLTDGGIETTLIFDEGLDLPEFAAFPLLADPAGRAALDRYFETYAAVAVRDRVGIVLETATWRANPDWGVRLRLHPRGAGSREPRRRRAARRDPPPLRDARRADRHQRLHRPPRRRLSGRCGDVGR